MLKEKIDEDRMKKNIGYRLTLENFKILISDKARKKSFDAVYQRNTKGLIDKLTDFQV